MWMKLELLVECLCPGRFWLTSDLKGNLLGPCCLYLIRIVDVSEPRDRYRHSVDVQVILEIDSLASTSIPENSCASYLLKRIQAIAFEMSKPAGAWCFEFVKSIPSELQVELQDKETQQE